MYVPYGTHFVELEKTKQTFHWIFLMSLVILAFSNFFYSSNDFLFHRKFILRMIVPLPLSLVPCYFQFYFHLLFEIHIFSTYVSELVEISQCHFDCNGALVPYRPELTFVFSVTIIFCEHRSYVRTYVWCSY